MGYKEPGKWWVAPSDYTDEVVNDFHFADKIEILDTTLRDGEQQPGIVLTRKDKVKIAKKLAEVGVQRIEGGHSRRIGSGCRRHTRNRRGSAFPPRSTASADRCPRIWSWRNQSASTE